MIYFFASCNLFLLSNKKRERGNWWFIRKDLSFAIQCYRRALEYLDTTVLNDTTKWNENGETESVTETELQAQLMNDCIKVYNNLAAALIETEAYQSALENVDIVLKHQPKNTKALYRKGNKKSCLKFFLLSFFNLNKPKSF